MPARRAAGFPTTLRRGHVRLRVHQESGRSGGERPLKRRAMRREPAGCDKLGDTSGGTRCTVNAVEPVVLGRIDRAREGVTEHGARNPSL